MGFEIIKSALEFNAKQPSIDKEDVGNNMCPYCIWPLKVNEDGEKVCPMCNRVWR